MLVINIDLIAGCDMLYAYGEDVKTDFEDFFVKISEKEGVSVPLKNMPANKRVTTLLWGSDGLPYFHAAQNSDQLYFRSAGVPSLLIFSGNMSSKYSALWRRKAFQLDFPTRPTTIWSFSNPLSEILLWIKCSLLRIR